MRRRDFLAFLTCFSAAPAFATALGAIGEEGLLDDMAKLVAIEEGTGPFFHILVSPGCDHSNAMLDAASRASAKVRVRWIPFSNGMPSGTKTLANLMASGTRESLRRALIDGALPGTPSETMMRIASAQDDYVQKIVARKTWNATGRPLAAPTMIFKTHDGSVRVLRGSLPEGLFRELVDLAA